MYALGKRIHYEYLLYTACHQKEFLATVTSQNQKDYNAKQTRKIHKKKGKKKKHSLNKSCYFNFEVIKCMINSTEIINNSIKHAIVY